MTAPSLNDASQPGFQFRLSTLFIVIAVVAFVLGAYVWWRQANYEFFHAILVGNTGPVSLRDEWPIPLKELLDDPTGVKCDESTIQVYCLCQGFDPEYVWKMDASPELFKRIEERWELKKMSDPKWYAVKGYRSHNSGEVAPGWWSPEDDGHTSFFVCPQELAREKGDRYHVALDEKRNLIFVHYWFNF